MQGRSAHGSMPDLGENAIDAAIAPDQRRSRSSSWRATSTTCSERRASRSDRSPPAPTSTPSPTAAASGSRSRSCPDRARRRTVAALERLAAQHGGRVELIEVTEPFETPPDSRLVTELDAATRAVTGDESEPIGVPAWTDAHNFVVFGGAEAVVFGPGEFDDRAHPRGARRRRPRCRVRRDLRPARGPRMARLTRQARHISADGPLRRHPKASLPGARAAPGRA